MSSKRKAARRASTMLRYERLSWSSGITHVAGIDEAGRGPLAGPVVAAAVIFPLEYFIEEVNDSKQLTGAQREILYDQILNGALAVGVGVVDNVVIDRINILNATYRAMCQAVDMLSIPPHHLLIDGNRFDPASLPERVRNVPYTTIVAGDAGSFSIAAASIIAKVTRDRIMIAYDEQFPGYGFAKHKGYCTKEHCDAIMTLGYSPIHRRSFSLHTQLELEF